MIPRVWLVSPIFFDAASFKELHERLQDVQSALPTLSSARWQHVIVDDSAGHDPEIDALRPLEGIKVIEAPFNLGHQRAIVYGIRSISPHLQDEDIVITLDADGEDQPEDLPRLLGPLLAEPDDRRRVALALRTKRRTGLRFKVMYLVFRTLFRLLTGTSVRTGNYAAYRGWLARRMLLHPHFDLCYSSSLLTLNRDLQFVPCERGERYAGRSRMGFSKLFMHGLRMMMPFTDRIAIRALVLFSVTFALGIVLALVVAGIRLFSDAAIPGWATYTIVGVLLLSFISLGNFITLFAVFSQSLGISLSTIDHGSDGPSRKTATPAG